VRRSELEPAAGGAAKRKKEDGRRAPQTRTASQASSAASRDLSGTIPEIHVIGQHVEEAIEAVDKALDQALLSGASHLRVVHGHGTGRLRDGLREHFRGHASVASMRPGGKNEGGNGATILELR
jgi:DNA mismatch repair protein MutS2